MTQADVDGMVAEFDALLDAEFEGGKTYQADKADWLDGKWSHMASAEGEDRRGDTAVATQRLRDIGIKLTAIPQRVNAHKTVRRVIEHRHAAIEAGEGIDWGTAGAPCFRQLAGRGLSSALGPE